eukprot:scaffold1803_cov92-Amphora_coffeaeformis.AAC.14
MGGCSINCNLPQSGSWWTVGHDALVGVPSASKINCNCDKSFVPAKRGRPVLNHSAIVTPAAYTSTDGSVARAPNNTSGGR